jgi:hypothetical protein
VIQRQLFRLRLNHYPIIFFNKSRAGKRSGRVRWFRPGHRGRLDFSGAANQYGVLTLLSSGASLFSTTTGVLGNLLGTDSAVSNPNNYANCNDNITSLVGSGGTFTLRFAEVNNVYLVQLNLFRLRQRKDQRSA